MLIRAYLRASTNEQDATRAKETLRSFAKEHGERVAAFYIENQSGASLDRQELIRLLDESESGDVLLVESVDRLTRLKLEDWEKLKGVISQKGVHVVSLDLPTSHMVFSVAGHSSDFMEAVLKAINAMLLDVLAASAYREYKERERKQSEGIKKAKAQGKYQGRQADEDMHERLELLTKKGLSINDTMKAVGCSRSTVVRHRKKLKELGVIE